jgi:hypothetical protein
MGVTSRTTDRVMDCKAVTWMRVDPVPTARRPFPSDAIELVNGETMATGTQRYGIACDLAPVTPDDASTQALIFGGETGDMLNPGSVAATRALDAGIRSFELGFGAVPCA